MNERKGSLLLGLVVLFFVLDLLSYELYGRGLIFGNLLTVQMHFNFSIASPDAAHQPSGKHQG